MNLYFKLIQASKMSNFRLYSLTSNIIKWALICGSCGAATVNDSESDAQSQSAGGIRSNDRWMCWFLQQGNISESTFAFRPFQLYCRTRLFRTACLSRVRSMRLERSEWAQSGRQKRRRCRFLLYSGTFPSLSSPTEITSCGKMAFIMAKSTSTSLPQSSLNSTE